MTKYKHTILEFPCMEEKEVEKSPEIPKAEYTKPSEIRFKLEDI